jgi:hypothetical protein
MSSQIALERREDGGHVVGVPLACLTVGRFDETAPAGQLDGHAEARCCSGEDPAGDRGMERSTRDGG